MQTYRRADGTEIREYRPPDEVFHADALASFDVAPLTNGHPTEGLLDAENTRRYQVGTIIAPKADGNRVRSQILVTDAETIAALKDGKTQLSCGYLADLDETPGVTPEGERYDAVQRNIRGNHVAIVAVGRAGPSVSVRMDSSDAEAFDAPAASLHSANTEPISIESAGDKMIKFKVDGVEVEVSEAAAALLEKQAKVQAETITALKADLDKMTAKADSAEAELKAAPAKFKAQAEARAELVKKAQAVMGAEANFDSATDDEIKAQVIASARPSLKLDGKSADYVAALFDAVVSDAEAGDEEETAEISERVDAADPVAAAKAKFDAALKKVQP